MKRFLENNYTKLLRLLPALLMMTVIFVHSAMPAVVSDQESSFFADAVARLLHLDMDTASFIVRKIAHFLEYLVLGICLMVFAEGFRMPEGTGSGKFFLRRGLPAWVCGTVYAVTDEFHQRFVPGRSCEFRDVCIDAAGILAGVGVWMIIRNIRSRHHKDKKMPEGL